MMQTSHCCHRIVSNGLLKVQDQYMRGQGFLSVKFGIMYLNGYYPGRFWMVEFASVAPISVLLS